MQGNNHAQVDNSVHIGDPQDWFKMDIHHLRSLSSLCHKLQHSQALIIHQGVDKGLLISRAYKRWCYESWGRRTCRTRKLGSMGFMLLLGEAYFFHLQISEKKQLCGFGNVHSDVGSCERDKNLESCTAFGSSRVHQQILLIFCNWWKIAFPKLEWECNACLAFYPESWDRVTLQILLLFSYWMKIAFPKFAWECNGCLALYPDSWEGAPCQVFSGDENSLEAWDLNFLALEVSSYLFIVLRKWLYVGFLVRL